MLNLLDRNFDCDCGVKHSLETEILLSGGDIEKISILLKKYYAVSRIAIVYDMAVSDYAQRVLEILVKNAFQISEICYEKLTFPSKADADRLIDLPENVRFFVGIGSGSITTIVRYAAHIRKNQYGIVATAPSTDSYLDDYSVFGDRKELCEAPKFLIADENIYASSKEYLTAGGIGAVFNCFLSVFQLEYETAVYKEKHCKNIIFELKNLLFEFLESYNRTNNSNRFLMETLLKISLARVYLGGLNSSANKIAYLLSTNENSRFYGENLFLAAFVTTQIYKEYLQGFTTDSLLPADYVKGLKLLNMRLNGEYSYNFNKLSEYKDKNITAIGYLIKEYRNDFLSYLDHVDIMDWAKLFRRCYRDAGYWLGGYIKANELLTITSLSGLICSNSLFSYVKETGFLEEML